MNTPLIKKLFIFCGLLFLHLAVRSQALSISFPSGICTNAVVTASVTSQQSGANYYTWSTNPASQIVGTSSSGTLVSISFTGCGAGTITCNAYSSSNSFLATVSQTYFISCPAATITPASQTICANSSATLSAGSAATYSWSTGAISNSVIVSPTVTSIYSLTVNSGSCPATATVTIFNITPSVSSASICVGTQATLSATGSNNYSWFSPSGTLGAGTSPSVVVTPTSLPTTYTVYSLLNTSCVINRTITIFPFGLSLTSSMPSSVCAGVSNTVFTYVSPATNYTWSSASQTIFSTPFIFSQNAVSNYTLNADSSGCSASRIYSVGIHPQPTVNISSASGTICPNQTIGLFAGGAVNYTWTNEPSIGSSLFGSSIQASPLLAQTVYTLTGASANGCTATANYTINVVPYTLLTAVPAASAVCLGFSTAIVASGAYDYTWTAIGFSTAVTGASINAGPGTYSLLGSNGGSCRDSLVITVGTLAALPLLATQSATSTCIDGNGNVAIVALSVSGANTYTWQPFVPGQMSFSLGPSVGVTPSTTTCYTVTGVANECTGTATLCIVSGYCNGLFDATLLSGIKIFPQPVKDVLIIETDAIIVAEIRIFTLSGEVVLYHDNNIQKTIPADIKNLSAGIYLMQLKSSDGLCFYSKIIKE